LSFDPKAAVADVAAISARTKPKLHSLIALVVTIIILVMVLACCSTS
jgi:hypothetical protein